MKKVSLITGMVILCCLVVYVFYNISKKKNEIDPAEFSAYFYEEIYEDIPRIIRNDFSEKRDLLLSEIVEDFSIVKLDSDNEEALLGSFIIPTFSENYIGIINGEPTIAFRLYDKKTGSYIGKIGEIGRGPGEYLGLIDAVIDEKNERVYLVPFAQTYIMEYSLDGEFIDIIHIPGKSGQSKMKIVVEDSIITAFILPNFLNSTMVYKFTKSGEILSSIPNQHGGTKTFDNEIFVVKGSDKIGYQSADCPIYYNYDPSDESFKPLFGIDRQDMAKNHWWGLVEETSNYYMIKVYHLRSGRNKDKDNYWLIMDKELNNKFSTNITNDYFGDIKTTHRAFRFFTENGTYSELFYAEELKDFLEEALKNRKMSSDMRDKVSKFNNSLSEEDNCIFFYGKLK